MSGGARPAPAIGFLYRLITVRVYDRRMDVAVTELRAHLSEWLERARRGDEVVITDRGVPVARLLGLTTTATLERLAADGVIGRPAAAQRPRASGRARPRPRRPLAGIVSEQRR
jgi:prevent-host-death family protein